MKHTLHLWGPGVQVTQEELAFEAPDDIIDGGGRFVQPGTFTLSVGELSAQARLAGDALLESDWLPLRRGTLSAPL